MCVDKSCHPVRPSTGSRTPNPDAVALRYGLRENGQSAKRVFGISQARERGECQGDEGLVEKSAFRHTAIAVFRNLALADPGASAS